MCPQRCWLGVSVGVQLGSLPGQTAPPQKRLPPPTYVLLVCRLGGRPAQAVHTRSRAYPGAVWCGAPGRGGHHRQVRTLTLWNSDRGGHHKQVQGAHPHTVTRIHARTHVRGAQRITACSARTLGAEALPLPVACEGHCWHAMVQYAWGGLWEERARDVRLCMGARTHSLASRSTGRCSLQQSCTPTRTCTPLPEVGCPSSDEWVQYRIANGDISFQPVMP